MEPPCPNSASLDTPTPSPECLESETPSPTQSPYPDSTAALSPIFEAAAFASFHDFFLGFFGTILYKKASDKSPFFLTTRLFNLRLRLPGDPKVSCYLEESSRWAARLVLQNEIDEVKLSVLTDSSLVLQQFVVKIGRGGSLTSSSSELESIRSGLRHILAVFSEEKTAIPLLAQIGGYFDIKLYDPRQALIDSMFRSSVALTPHVFHVHVAILVKQLFFNVYVLTYAPIAVAPACVPTTNSNSPPCVLEQDTLPKPARKPIKPKPTHDPEQLLRNLAPLLDPQSGGIGSHLHVPIILNLMIRFSAKTVTKCMYINILHSTAPNLLRPFMEQGGWNLLRVWLCDVLSKADHKMIQELLLLIHRVEVTPEILGLNDLPKLLRDMAMNTHPTVRAVAKRIDTNWRSILALEGEGRILKGSRSGSESGTSAKSSEKDEDEQVNEQ